jgi:hypothetical protein
MLVEDEFVTIGERERQLSGSRVQVDDDRAVPFRNGPWFRWSMVWRIWISSAACRL